MKTELSKKNIPGIANGKLYASLVHALRLSDSEFWGALGLMGFPGGSGGKESACSAGDLGSIQCRISGFDP